MGEAVEGLPPEFRELLRQENVLIAVEEEPTDQDLEVAHDDDELLGIFRGPMRTGQHHDDLPDLPSECVVFRGPVLRCTSSRREAVHEIRDTIVHELGHYFGLEDDDMPF